MRRLTAAIGIVAAIVSAPTVAFADAAGPTDYLTEITGISPVASGDAFDVDIVGGDAFVRLRVAPGHEVVVLGYAPHEEPYLRFRADGTVERNSLSYATYYNEDRYGRSDIPDTVDTAAAPDWEVVGHGGEYAWHDHRAHWMSEQPLIGLDPGESLPAETIPLVVDGVDAHVTVVTTLQESPSPLPAVAGTLLGALIGLIAFGLGRATSVLAGAVLSLVALVAGLGQFWSLPSSTGPSLAWWLLPAIALTCSTVVIGIYRRSLWTEAGLLAIGGLQLLLWAWQRRGHASRAYVPTDLPVDLDRMITTAVAAGAMFVVAAALRPIVAALRSPSA